MRVCSVAETDDCYSYASFETLYIELRVCKESILCDPLRISATSRGRVSRILNMVANRH